MSWELTPRGTQQRLKKKKYQITFSFAFAFLLRMKEVYFGSPAFVDYEIYVSVTVKSRRICTFNLWNYIILRIPAAHLR